MPEDAQKNIQVLLGTLEDLKNSKDDGMYTCKSYFKLLNTLTSTLASCQDITSTDAERVLTTSLQYIMDMECAPYVLSNISSLIKMNKAKTFEPVVEFLPSALAILEFLKKNFGENKHNLQAFSFQVLMSHPDAALIKLVKDHCSVLIETFELFLSIKSKCTLDVKIEALIILQLLSILPTDERSIFVKEGIPLWLSSVLPAIIQTLVTREDTEKIQKYVTYLELLASELVAHDYFEYPEWKMFLGNVVDFKKFPMSIKTLMEQSKTVWHRVWIVIIKLLKSYVTKFHGSCSPINALLPVVETAFKQDCRQRVRAFECWDQLIRNFASETNTDSTKRVKLLVIPIRLNNTRTEDTAMAKFNTWWLFVREYKSRLESFTELILIEFIHFLFGKEQSSKSSYWVGRVSENIRKLCLEAFVEVVGHSECEESSRCTSIVPLGGTVIKTVMLDEYWADWLYAIKCAVKVVAVDYKPETQKNIRCIWKSFMLLLTEVVDGSAGKFNDLIKMLSVLAQNSVIYEDFTVMVIEDLILPLCKDVRMQRLLISSPDHHPMHKLVTLIMDKTFDSYYKRFMPQDLSNILQPIVSNLLSESMTNPEYTIQLLNDLPTTDSSLKLWTEFVRAASELDLSLELLSALLKWPFKVVQNSTNVKDAALAWFRVYNAVHVKLDKIGFSDDISKLLTKSADESEAVKYFILFALIIVLKIKPDEKKMVKLEALAYEMNNYEYFEPLIPPLVETLTFIIDNISDKPYDNLAQTTINCMNNLLGFLNSEASTNEQNKYLMSSKATNIDEQANIIYINKTVLSDTIILSMKKFLEKSTDKLIKKEIINIISSYDEGVIESSDKSPKEFASPKVKEVKKKSKTVSRIVNTVDENGEEYVVVNSNWKFNPKNLTENQKEKFKRKRDIPALYQDLSQSQDEFKLTAWKTNSQDTSLSSSKSSKSTNNDASEILKNMTGTDVVPKIMENMTESAKNCITKMCVDSSPASNDKLLKVDEVVRTPKGTKSRITFKDRFLHNARNLVKISSPSTHIENVNDVIPIDSVCKSPILKPSDEKTDKTCIQIQKDNASKSPVPEPKAMNRLLIDKEDKNQNINLVQTPAKKTKKGDNIINSALPLQTSEKPGFCDSAAKTKKGDEITDLITLPQQSVEIPVIHTPAKAIDNQLIDKEDSETHVTKSINADSNVIAVTEKEGSQNIKLVHTPAKKKKRDGKTTNSTLPLQSNKRPTVHTPVTKTKKHDRITDTTLPLQSDQRPADDTPVTTKRKYVKITDSTLPLSSDEKTAVHTPATKYMTKLYDKITDSSSPRSEERPARMKRKPKKFDDIVLLPLKRTRNSNEFQTNSQESIVPELIVPQVHTLESAKHNTGIDLAGITANEINEASNKGNENQAPTITEDVFRVLNDVCSIESNITERDILITPTTPITDKIAEKSPEKPTNIVEVPGHKDKALHGIENTETKLLDEPQDLNKNKSLVTSLAENITVKESYVVVPRINKLFGDNKAQKNIHDNDEKSESKTSPSVGKKAVSPKSTVAEKQVQIKNNVNEIKILEKKATPMNIVEAAVPKSSVKKTPRKSRIESELMIDMVEGHPFLNEQSEKRITRKKMMEVENNSRRKSFAGKLKNSKLEATPRSTKNLQEKKFFSSKKTFTVEESQDKQSSLPVDSIMDEPPCSEDIIESSQDSTITTVSVKSTKLTTLKPIVSLERLKINETQDLIMTDHHNEENHEKTDIELPQNKTAEVDINTSDLTENMDTEPIGDINASIDVIIIDNSEPTPIIINSEPVIGPETQELAEADTQPNDSQSFIDIEGYQSVGNQPQTVSVNEQNTEKEIMDNDITQSLPEPPLLANIENTSDASSPFKNDNLRKQDFLNNTLEISPIKIRSPEREKKSPSPETSSDFVVITLSPPVHSNGEQFEKLGSPEFFTEDKVSPDKRDVSPPRTEVTVTNTSPSSSLSLKKKRPPVRSGGRAAQMLDLCVNTDLKITKVTEHIEPEEIKKATSAPVRRNSRIVYNTLGENSDIPSDQDLEEDDNFLKLKRTLPTVTSSPSGPILKRKLIDIMDDTTTSPASKRKRVSFHDPPVSTSISVQKYIEPLSLVRSPPSSGKKRFDRQTRLGIKSPKRLENTFNLDSVLSKTVESFTEATPTDDTQNTSLDVTPIVEIVKSSELNDTDPFYPDLVHCKDPIDVIATELSSPAMRELFVKELEGKVETVGDLAKMTELEINRLCIKAPKIKVAKKVLTDYAAERQANLIETVIEEVFCEPCFDMVTTNIESQTEVVEVGSTEVQTVIVPTIVACTQTESVLMAHTSMQTDESESKTEDIISSCIAKGGDFIEKLSEQLDENSIKTVAEILPAKAMFELLINKSKDSTTLLNRLLQYQSKDVPEDKKHSAELSFIGDHLCKRYGHRDLITLCTQVLQNINDKSA